MSSSAEDQPTAVADCNGDKWAAASAQKSREWYGRSTHSRLGEKHLRINSGLYKDEKRSANVEWLPPEQEDGNTEYKLCLTTPHSVRFEHLVCPPPAPCVPVYLLQG